MSRIIHQSLTAILLLLFSSENIALASMLQDDDDNGTSVHQHTIAQQELPTLFNLLAEENEERDERDDNHLHLGREVFHSHCFPLITSDKFSDHRGANISVRAVPIYTYHCTFLI